MCIARILAFGWLAACLSAPTASAGSGPREGYVAVSRLSDAEVEDLRLREATGLTGAEKVKHDDWVARITACATERTKLTAAEILALRRQCDPSLEATEAFGDRSMGKRLALYLPNVLLDTLDSFSLGVGLIGIGLGTDFHITRYAGLGLGGQAALVNLHWYFNRNLAVSGYGVAGVVRGGSWEAYYVEFLGAGLTWKDGKPDSGLIHFKKRGKFSKDDPMVQQGYSDPYGIGLGWAFELHPVELADWLAGLFTLNYVDISEDDLGNPARHSIKSYMRRP